MHFPRVHIKRKLVCVYSVKLEMFEVREITNKGKVSKHFAPRCAFTNDIRAAFRSFAGIPFAGFKAVHGINKDTCKTWNEFIETVWEEATKNKMPMKKSMS